PYWVDEITGESGMSEDNRRAAIAALEVVKEKLGVDIKWVSYPTNIKQCLLQTVLAGDPLCHIPIMANGSQGTILSQNVLQPLDKYKDIFDSNPDYSWMLVDKCFGKYYLINRDFLYMNNWPLVYNATYIEEVPALKQNGKTVYPATLYEQGQWTWSTFEDYLSKIKTYFNGKKAATGNNIYAFHTNYMYTILFALHSNGACLYDGSNISIDSEEGKVAAEYLDGLLTKELAVCLKAGPNSVDTGYMAPTNAFMNGESVFNNAARWMMDNCGSALAERGESMGVIPWPRPDDIVYTDPYADYADESKRGRYQIYSSVADSVGLLKGFSEEESRLALEAYAMYRSEFYKALGHVDSFEEYKETMVASKAVEDGVDIFHPEIGDANLRIYKQLGNVPENGFGESIEVFWSYAQDVFGRSVYGVGGTPKYRINVEAKKSGTYNKIDSISKALNSGEVVDNVVPNSARTDSSPLVFGEGTNPAKINWLDYITASDNVDGEYEMKEEKGKIVLRGKADITLAEEEAKEAGLDEPEEVPFEGGRFAVDTSAVDFNQVGKYEEGIVVKVTDKAGNVGEKKYTVYIYDKENTVPPTLELKEELKTITVDADTSEINWGDYVEKAEDVNGIDLKTHVTADVTQLDVTIPGKYPVTIYVKDFVGNKTEIPVVLEVKAE
ncbi:MAG: hypothetical protein ACI4SS_03175, partial [Clostridia bacterium]